MSLDDLTSLLHGAAEYAVDQLCDQSRLMPFAVTLDTQGNIKFVTEDSGQLSLDEEILSSLRFSGSIRPTSLLSLCSINLGLIDFITPPPVWHQRCRFSQSAVGGSKQVVGSQLCYGIGVAQDRFKQVMDRIDELNTQDPNQELVEGVSCSKELAYSKRVTDWVKCLESHPSEELLIAARGQHVQRWTIPRDRYKRDRKGYLLWRETLKVFHAKTVTDLMREAGYPQESTEQVERIIRKTNIR